MTKVSEIKQFQSAWAKPVVDLKHNTIITIESQMKSRPGKDFSGNETTLYDIEISYDNPEGDREEKLLQLNAGNAKAIAEVYGDDDSAWIKKEMACVLVPDAKSKQGKRLVLVPPMKMAHIESSTG